MIKIFESIMKLAFSTQEVEGRRIVVKIDVVKGKPAQAQPPIATIETQGAMTTEGDPKI